MKSCNGLKQRISLIGKTLFLLAACMMFASNSGAQIKAAANHENYRIGFVAGRGTQEGLNLRYRYHVVILPLPEFYQIALKKKRWSLDILTHPQFNLTRLRPIDDDPALKNGIEFGLNCGLVGRYEVLAKRVALYGGLSAGPHYVSATPARQTRGFIFSDNAFAGINLCAAKDLWIDLRIGFRHISNAGIRNPNGGVNNKMLSAGCLLDL